MDSHGQTKNEINLFSREKEKMPKLSERSKVSAVFQTIKENPNNNFNLNRLEE